ncbi:hypothetical protein CYMTET_46127 [Cymbomonas tetramitiformis]|uniref:Uncharacterized protein n=1 Tax=Cymbomonas tetramitiformis TaxID=36881 RepID=A0AAE0EXL7_9CHLO|nr:hypothetical protein CYMTET_46127 [Cymbomonas tetramitiformis]
MRIPTTCHKWSLLMCIFFMKDAQADATAWPENVVAHQTSHLAEGNTFGAVKEAYGQNAVASKLSLAEDSGVQAVDASDFLQNGSASATPVLSGSAREGPTSHRLSVLQNAKPEDVQLSPYPHLIVKNALPREIYNQLAAAYPGDKELYQISRGTGKQMKENWRYDIRGVQAMANRKKLSPLWIEFVKYHVSPAFYKEVIRIFGEAVKQHRPDIEIDNNKSLADLNVALRYTEDLATDLVMDCQVGMNSPSKSMSTVRGPHHDAPEEVWAGLLYFRQPKDKSKGGDLQVLGCKGECKEVPEHEKRKRKMSTKQGHEHFDYRDLNVINTAKYEANTLAWFVNTPYAVHAVTPRQPTKFSRHLINFIAEKVERDAQGKIVIKEGNKNKAQAG